MIVDVTIRIRITVGHHVLARVTNRLYAACLIVLLMVIGEPGANGQIARVIVEWRQDIALVPALILHPHMAGEVVKVKLRNTTIASWTIAQVCNAQHFLFHLIDKQYGAELSLLRLLFFALLCDWL